MPKDTRFRKLAIVASALAWALVSRPASASHGKPLAVRMVMLGGEVTDPRVVEHVLFCRALGFNALWIYSHQAGVWSPQRAPRGPIVDPAFVRAAKGWRRHGLDPWVSINPVDDTGERFVFSDSSGEDRLVRFVEMLRSAIGLKHLVISFDDQPTELTELRDVLKYGTSAAPAHLDLMRRLASRLPGDLDLWLCSADYCDAHVADGAGAYSRPFLAGLHTVPPRVGIVWTGPLVVSPSITGADLLATRARLGGRRLLVYDNAYSTDNPEDDGMALLLSPLRQRDAGIRSVADAYLAACPVSQLGGSRLALITIAAWLRDPEGYDPAQALSSAMRRLAGRGASDKDTWAAFDTQQLEWGGWVGQRNYWPRDLLNPEIVARRLTDPAFVSSFTWTEERYPGRISALARIEDAPFREDLLKAMRYRLAIAQALPLVMEYLARVRAGRADAGVAKSRIDDLRRAWVPHPEVARVLDLFLSAASVPPS